MAGDSSATVDRGEQRPPRQPDPDRVAGRTAADLEHHPGAYTRAGRHPRRSQRTAREPLPPRRGDARGGWGGLGAHRQDDVLRPRPEAARRSQRAVGRALPGRRRRGRRVTRSWRPAAATSSAATSSPTSSDCRQRPRAHRRRARRRGAAPVGRRGRVRPSRCAARRPVRRVRARARDPRRSHTSRASDELHGRRLLACHRQGRCVRGRAGPRLAERCCRTRDRVRVWFPSAVPGRAGASRRSGAGTGRAA